MKHRIVFAGVLLGILCLAGCIGKAANISAPVASTPVATAPPPQPAAAKSIAEDATAKAPNQVAANKEQDTTGDDDATSNKNKEASKLASKPIKSAKPIRQAQKQQPHRETQPKEHTAKAKTPATNGARVVKTDEEWQKILTPEQFDVTRKQGTERAYTGAYWNNHEKGLYRCVCCGAELFLSDTKFDSGTGWPSFWSPISKQAVQQRHDASDGMEREEVVCSRCGAHLGHVFDDGPEPTHLRYCMNSVALTFLPAK